MRYFPVFFAVSLCLCGSIPLASQAVAASEPQDVEFTAACDGTPQRFVVLLPEGYDAARVCDVLIALHGHGSDRWQFIKDGRDECRAVRDAAAEYGMILVSPDYRAKTSWMGPKAEADLLQIIEEVKKAHAVGKVFLCGGSMGGSAALTFAALHPDLIAGVASMNGTANHLEYENFQDAIAESFGGSKPQIPAEYKKRSAEYWPERLTMPVGITVGGQDRSVPPDSAVRLARVLGKIGRPVLLIQRENGGHSTSYDDARAILAFAMGVTSAASQPAAVAGWDPKTLPRCTRVGDQRPPAPWKALADYPRPSAPDTGWGIHDDPNCIWQAEDPDAFFKEMKQKYGFSWFKVLACGRNKLEVVKAARRQGVEPVVRLYVERPSPHFPEAGSQEASFRADVVAYVAAGARYFESGNEPNLGMEWAEGEWEKPERIERLCRQWLRVVPMIKEGGGIPVFYAMTPGTAGTWYADCFETFKKWDKIEEAFAGCAIGSHLCSLNHPIDYPFNSKKNLPHATREERFNSLRKDNSCYLLGELIMHLMDEYLPYPVPILSTEGGTGINSGEDTNYPKMTPELHREMNLDIFRRFNPDHPKYWGDPLLTQMSWIYHTDAGVFMFDSWFRHPVHGDLPIIKALETEPRFDRSKAFKE